jgi:bis(5'-nucleosidyl)-tetraphosphatase
MVHEKSCGAVVFRKAKEIEYLLLHYGAGHWGFARGQIESGETEKDTVLRELAEETGITNARFVDGFRKEMSYFYRREGKTVFKEVVLYLVEALNSEVKLSYEHVGFEWLQYDKALERLTFENSKSVLRKANEYLKTLEDKDRS